MFATEHIDRAIDAERAATRDLAGRRCPDLADRRGAGGNVEPPQRFDRVRRTFRRNEGDEAAFIRDMQRIEAQ